MLQQWGGSRGTLGLGRSGRRGVMKWPVVLALATTPAMLVPCAMLASCASQPTERTTRLRASDLEIGIADVREDLAASAFLTGRTAESGQLRIVPSEMVNLSSDRLARIDRWAAVTKVLFDPSMRALLEARNIQTLMPRDTALLLTRYGVNTDPNARVAPVGMDESPDFAPTHVFGARVLSITRAASWTGDQNELSNLRQETVRVEYSIVELQSRRVEWSGAHEFKRVATGLLID